MTTIPNAGFKALLAHLHSPELKVPLETLQSALAHQLAEVTPSPTPLTAAAISSPHFTAHIHTLPRIQALSIAFRHAVQLRFRILSKGAENTHLPVFSRSLHSQLREWSRGVLQGLLGGNPVLRVSALSGLLLGREDVKAGHSMTLDWHKVEDELLVALAEVLDTYPSVGPPAGWEEDARGVHPSSLVLILVSQSLPLVEQKRLTAFPLRLLIQMLVSVIATTFVDGEFLSQLSAAIVKEPNGLLGMPSNSSFASAMQSVLTSPQFASMSSLARITAMSLELLISTKPEEGVIVFTNTLQVLCAIARNVELDWSRSVLATLGDNEEAISPDSRSLSKSIWTCLKTILFSVIMIADAGLSADIFLRPNSTTPAQNTPSEHALLTLKTFSHLAFVISKFGGVTTTSVHAFKELKKCFYLALDVLASAPAQTCENLVNDLYHSTSTSTDPTLTAKTAYALAAVEQLVPVLGFSCIEDVVFPMCYPHLYDATHRETFESAHSVILSIFAAHAQKGQQSEKPPMTRIDTSAPTIPGFMERLVPFYAHCLIENSVDGHLSTDQLRLAYTALVRSASTSSTTSANPDETYALAWYCITKLLEAITTARTLPASITAHTFNPNEAPENTANKTNHQLHRLRLTLISTASSLPLPLLMRVLEEIRIIILTCPWSDSGVEVMEEPEEAVSLAQSTNAKPNPRAELVEALFSEIMGQVGDREKEAAMRWWYDHREKLMGGDRIEITSVGESQKMADGSKKAIRRGGMGEENQSPSVALSRL